MLAHLIVPAPSLHNRGLALIHSLSEALPPLPFQVPLTSRLHMYNPILLLYVRRQSEQRGIAHGLPQVLPSRSTALQ